MYEHKQSIYNPIYFSVLLASGGFSLIIEDSDYLVWWVELLVSVCDIGISPPGFWQTSYPSSLCPLPLISWNSTMGCHFFVIVPSLLLVDNNLQMLKVWWKMTSLSVYFPEIYWLKCWKSELIWDDGHTHFSIPEHIALSMLTLLTISIFSLCLVLSQELYRS